MSARKLLSASFANLLIPISGLVVGPLLSREMGPDGRGLYAALTLPIVVYGWIGTYGLQDALSYHVRDGRLSERAALRASLTATVPLGLLGFGLLAILGLFVFPKGDEHYPDFLVLSLLSPLHILANLLIGALTGAGDVRGVNLVKVVPALVRTGLVVVACLAFDLTAYWAGLLFVASVAGGLVIGLVRLRRPPGSVAPFGEPPAGPTGVPDRQLPIRSLVVYALTCLPGVLAAVSSARLDQIIGLPVIGAQELGYYAVAVSVAEIPMVIATAARTVLLGRPGADDRSRASVAARLAVLASIVASAILAAAASTAVPWVFGTAFTPAVGPTLILCAATTLYTGMVIFTAVLLASGRAAWSSGALVAGSASGIMLLILLAPLGAVGAAIASVGGYGVSVVIAGWAVHRAPGLPSLRDLTIPYRADLRSLRTMVSALAGRRAFGADRSELGVLEPVDARRGWRRLGSALAAGSWGDVGTRGVGLLLILAWLRGTVPLLIQMFGSGRPDFNSSANSVPRSSDLVGDGISLLFILVALFLAGQGIYRRRPVRLWWLAVVLAPFVAIEVSGLFNQQRPTIVSLALPLAMVAIWLQPPGRNVLKVIAVLGSVTAAGSILLSLIRPDIALLTGTAVGDKDAPLGGLLAGPYLHSNVLGIALVLSVPFVFCVANRLARLGMLVVVLFALYWTGSRSSQFAAAVVLLTYLLIKLVPSRTWLVSVVLATGFAAVVCVPLLATDPDAFTRRGRIWRGLLDYWAERPFLGYGPRFFQQRTDLTETLGGEFTHGHNIMVQFLVVGGVVTTALVALLLAIAWRQSLALTGVGVPAASLFLVALSYVSWLEASHVPNTLAGYVTWLPLIILVRLGLDLRTIVSPDPQGATRDGEGRQMGRPGPVPADAVVPAAYGPAAIEQPATPGEGSGSEDDGRPEVVRNPA